MKKKIANIIASVSMLVVMAQVVAVQAAGTPTPTPNPYQPYQPQDTGFSLETFILIGISVFAFGLGLIVYGKTIQKSLTR